MVSPAPSSRAEIAKNLLCEADRSEGDRDRARADFRVGSNAFGNRKRVLKQSLQLLPQRAGGTGFLIGGLDLAEYLRLAQDHRVQSRGDTHHVSNRVTFRVTVEMGPKDAGLHGVLKAQPVHQSFGIRLPTTAVNLSPVAGRQDCSFADIAARHQIGERHRQLLGRESNPFPQFNGSRFMVNA
jgi:hypothetical protein